jgi:hypothetical protein
MSNATSFIIGGTVVVVDSCGKGSVDVFVEDVSLESDERGKAVEGEKKRRRHRRSDNK